MDETLDPLDPATVSASDVVGIGIHTGNALRGYAIGQMARARGAWVVFGGIHATLFPDEAHEQGGAHAVVRGDGDVVWPRVVEDCLAGHPLAVYEGGRVDAEHFAPARWDLLPEGRYMWGSVQTVRGCPKPTFTSWVPSSSACRATTRTASTPRWRWRNGRTSPSRSSCCSRRFRAPSTSRSGRPRKATVSGRCRVFRSPDIG